MRWMFVVLMVGLCFVVGCSSSSTPALNTGGNEPPVEDPEDDPVEDPVDDPFDDPDPTSGPPSAGYTMIWYDEFSGTELDRSKWSYRMLGPRREAVNVRNTVALDGEGHLVLTIRSVEEEIHAAMIGTEGRFAATYGYFEARVLMQSTRGGWTGFWLQTPLMNSSGDDPTHNGAEIDIYECFEPDNNVVGHYVHWNGYGDDARQVGFGNRPVSNLTGRYHTFGLEWTPTEYVFYVDGQVSARTSQGVSGRDEYIVLSAEVDEEDAAIIRATPHFTDSVYFDYIRVYQKL